MLDYERISVVAPYIDGLLEEKRANGFAYETEESVLNRFDMYCASNGLDTLEITEEFLSGWMEQQCTEGAFNHGKRISVVRQLLKYMASTGIYVFIPEDFCHVKRAVPHIFDPLETKAFFHELDNYTPGCFASWAWRVAGEHRLLFRFYNCCGLRNSEAANLRTENVNMEEGVLTILNSKGQKDRLVYMPDDLTSSCKEYYPWLCQQLCCKDSVLFFPGKYPDKPLSAGGIDYTFRKLWDRTEFANCNNKPTVHDFRFTFVVNRLNLWAKKNIDLKVMLPYLSRYLGHKTTKETLYYYWLAKDAYTVIAEKDTIANDVIPEVDYDSF